LTALFLALLLGEGDADFLRRAWLDLTGGIPSAAEARAFLDDRDPAKREKLVDRLLASPDYPRRLEEAFTVMLLERRGGNAVPDRAWRDWLRARFAEDAPWDETVRLLLSADGRDPATRPATKFFLDGRTDLHRATLDVGRLFLGRNLLCAQCHDHPQVKEWKQLEYMGLYAYLSTSKPHTDAKSKVQYFMDAPPTKKVEYQNVFRPEAKKQTGPLLQGAEEVSLPANAEWEIPPVKNGFPGVPKLRLRDQLAHDLASAEHAQFVRTSVNRLWTLLNGRGIVHPPDLDHAKNPPSDPALLDDLARRFVEGGLRFKSLVRSIVLGPGPRSAKPLSPEQLTRRLLLATGQFDRVSAAPPAKGFSLKDYLSGKKTAPPADLEQTTALFVAVFGAPAGEPEVDFSPSSTHALFLRNDRLILDWTAALAKRVAAAADPAEELYLSALTRRPTAEERAEFGRHAAVDVAWALIASAEFRLNP
jgi:hypothetical protein